MPLWQNRSISGMNGHHRQMKQDKQKQKEVFSGSECRDAAMMSCFNGLIHYRWIFRLAGRSAAVSAVPEKGQELGIIGDDLIYPLLGKVVLHLLDPVDGVEIDATAASPGFFYLQRID